MVDNWEMDGRVNRERSASFRRVIPLLCVPFSFLTLPSVFPSIPNGKLGPGPPIAAARKNNSATRQCLVSSMISCAYSWLC